MKNIRKVVMVIIGTIIGAGFASGKEIYLFFNRYGTLGQIGIIFSGLFTAFIIYLVLKLQKEQQISKYSDLLEKLNPKHTKINNAINIMVNSFLLISFFIMVAGFSAYIKQSYQIPTYISSIIFVILCYLIFQKSLQGMMKLNNYVVPLLLIFILFLAVKNIPYLIETKPIMQEEVNKFSFLFSSFLYASYNSIILIPVLISMNSYIRTKKEISFIAIISAIIIIILSFCIYGLLIKGQFLINEVELPLLEITAQFGKEIYMLYGLVIIISIITSAISTGYSFLENVSKTKKNYQINLALISIGAILVSNIGFSKLVEILYPLFGVLGFLQIIYLWKSNF